MTETAPLDELLTIVKRLTSPYKDRTLIVDDDPQHGTDKKVIASLHRRGLLRQLRDAIVGGIGSHEGAAAGRERIPFDTGALALYEAIERDITERFMIVARRPVYLELEQTLDQWYIHFKNLYMSKQLTDDALNSALRAAEGWETKITGHFDKPKQLEVTINLYERDDSGQWVTEKGPDGKERRKVAKRLPAPCPNCGEAYAHHPKTGDKTFSLLLEYRELGPDTMSSATGLCRFCEEVWRAGAGMRELAYGVEVAEHELNTPVEEAS